MPAHSLMPSSPFPDRLLAWWDRHGRKDLPWQNPRSPYRVWISEVMLQQTQVATVVEYFERWMDRFPRLTDLARADLDDVLALWSGLGYYARARNLHKTARICADQFNGDLPFDFESLTKLPGIGPSTSNAILSLAYHQPAAILDGNVKRLLARHAGIEGWPGSGPVQRALWKQAEARLPDDRAADYSQAVMDMGALVCTRSNPDCEACPVANDCQALIMGKVGEIPGRKPKKKILTRTIHILIILDDRGRVLLERRPPSGIWGGLWSLPESDSQPDLLARFGLNDDEKISGRRSLPEHEHRLTHLHMLLRPEQVTLPHGSGLEYRSVGDQSKMAWFSQAELRQLGLPKPVNTLLSKLATESIE